MDFSAMFQTWIKVLTKPGEDAFAEERGTPNATLVTALIWMVIAAVIVAVFGAIGAVISGFIGGGSSLLSSGLLDGADLPPEIVEQLAVMSAGGGAAIGASFCMIVLVPIGFLISSAIYFGVAKAVGGTGSFEEHTYMLATFTAPIAIVNAVIGVIPVLGACVSLFIWIYQIVLTYFSMKVTHDLTTGKALIVALTPVIILIVCFICLFLFIFLGAFSAAAGVGG